jgi:hypothetical protein
LSRIELASVDGGVLRPKGLRMTAQKEPTAPPLNEPSFCRHAAKRTFFLRSRR